MITSGLNHREGTGYVTFIINGVVVAANVHGPGAAEKAGIPPLDSLGVEDIQVYKAHPVPAGYLVCPGVAAVIIVTKRAVRLRGRP